MELEKKEELIGVTTSFENLFQDTPRRTNAIVHDMQVENVEPIKQHPYRVNPKKREMIRKEIEYVVVRRNYRSTNSLPSQATNLIFNNVKMN